MIQEKVKKKTFPYTWEYFRMRKENKVKYINIYQHSIVREYESETNRTFPNFTKSNYFLLNLKANLDQMLLEIEDLHTVEEILLFRYTAEKELTALKDSNKKKG